MSTSNFASIRCSCCCCCCCCLFCDVQRCLAQQELDGFELQTRASTTATSTDLSHTSPDLSYTSPDLSHTSPDLSLARPCHSSTPGTPWWPGTAGVMPAAVYIAVRSCGADHSAAQSPNCSTLTSIVSPSSIHKSSAVSHGCSRIPSKGTSSSLRPSLSLLHMPLITLPIFVLSLTDDVHCSSRKCTHIKQVLSIVRSRQVSLLTEMTQAALPAHQ